MDSMNEKWNMKVTTFYKFSVTESIMNNKEAVYILVIDDDSCDIDLKVFKT